LSRWPRPDREQVTGALSRALSPADAATVLAALAGTAEEVAALPEGLQDAAQVALLDAFPDGLGAIIVSRLGIARFATERWLPQLREQFESMAVEAVAHVYRDVLRRHRSQKRS
jgi:hypothetical protein